MLWCALVLGAAACTGTPAETPRPGAADGYGGDHGVHAGPVDSDYRDIRSAPTRAATPSHPGAATGTWTSRCTLTGHRNIDNVVLQPGKVGGAHHTHEYAGNTSTNALSTDESLAAAPTTCDRDDRSTYYWPVLRLVTERGPDADAAGGGKDGNHGRIVDPDSVLIRYHGNAVSNVVAMPRFMRSVTGNPTAVSDGGKLTDHVTWTCSGERQRVSRHYPRCAEGQQVVRVLEFPSCWNGLNTDSAGHRAHLRFPVAGGACAADSFPVPRLVVELSYSLAPNARYAIDSFPSEGRSPITDHAMFVGAMPDALMTEVVDCLNQGRAC